MKLRALRRSTNGDRKIPERSRRVDGRTAMLDLDYTYSVLGKDGVEVTLKRHKGKDTRTTVRALMKRVARGDKPSKPVLQAIMWKLLDLLHDLEDDPNGRGHDLVPVLKRHWSELVDGACASLVRIA